MRLYVGGLPPDITARDLEGRFRPFGAVASCEIVPSKGPAADPGACRGFAYVSFEPKDDAALARCLSLVRAFSGGACLSAAPAAPRGWCALGAPRGWGPGSGPPAASPWPLDRRCQTWPDPAF